MHTSLIWVICLRKRCVQTQTLRVSHRWTLWNDLCALSTQSHPHSRYHMRSHHFPNVSKFDFNLSANVPDLKFINLLTNGTLNTSSTSQSALPQVSVQRSESHQAVRNEALQSYTQMSEHDSRMSSNASRLVSIEVAEQSVSNDSIHRLVNLEHERSSRVPTIMKHCRDGRILLQAASQYVMRKIM